MPLQASYDLIILGSGLAGLFAGILAARRGAHTLIVAHGLGNTHLGTGTVDVWGYKIQDSRLKLQDPNLELTANPQAQLSQIPKTHPLALAGDEALQAALQELQKISMAANYPLLGNLMHNHYLPTALGAPRPTCLAPRSFMAGDLTRPHEMVLARLPGFRDFYADLAVDNLNATGHAARAVTLPLPQAPLHRDAFATDLARLFDDEQCRAEIASQWREPLKDVERLGLPAILGLRHPVAAHADLEEKLGLEIFEIPILPPSVPGVRLYEVLRQTFEAAGGRVIVGPRVTGWVENGRVLGVVAATAGGPRHYAAQQAVILATGGVRHGGLVAPAPNQLRETVFDLPVASVDEWFAPLYWQAQPYAHFGVRVNAHMQPLNVDHEVVHENLYAIGGLLAGADRLTEGSREGIDIATAWKAVESQ